MNPLELNEYFERYLEKDVTHRAVMLTAPWGEGKTYYIKNQLAPYLLKKGHKCVYVSLYGLQNLKELNKQLFMEINMCNFAKSTTKKAGFKIAGKTIIKGIASFFGINLEQSEKDWQKLYDSVDLTNKLIVFDDLERSQIDISEFLGYVNNLVEQDGIKVIVVTSEKNIYKYIDKKDDKGKIVGSIPDDKTKKYMEIKEKTFGDTVVFHCEMINAINSILKIFDNVKFQKLVDYKSQITQLTTAERIQQLFYRQNVCNLRQFLYACQKMCDLISEIDKELNLEYLQNVFLGIVAFCLKNNTNRIHVWEYKELTSGSYGTNEFPLYRFAFNYIKYQSLDQEEVKELEKEFVLAILQNKVNEKLQVLYSCYMEKEKNVIDAISTIKIALKKENIIPFSEYIRIVNYLVYLKPILDISADLNEIKDLMIKNIKNAREEDKEVKLTFFTGISLETKEQNIEFEQIKQQLYIEQNTAYLVGEINSNKVSALCEYIETHNDYFMKQKGFLSKIPIKQITEALNEASSADIVNLRRDFQYVYSFSNLRDYYSNDIPYLQQLLQHCIVLKDDSKLDKIQKKNIYYFEEDLEKYLETLIGEKVGESES